METVRWKPLLIAKEADQLQRLTLQLDANKIPGVLSIQVDEVQNVRKGLRSVGEVCGNRGRVGGFKGTFDNREIRCTDPGDSPLRFAAHPDFQIEPRSFGNSNARHVRAWKWPTLAPVSSACGPER